MNLYKIAVCIFFIQFHQLVIASSIIRQSQRLFLQQIREIRTKPTGHIQQRKKTKEAVCKVTDQVVENNVNNSFDWTNFTGLKKSFLETSILETSISRYKRFKDFAVKTGQELTGNITENKIVNQELLQANQSVLVAKTNSAQETSGFFNHNDTTNHVTHITNNYYAPETLAQTLTKDPEKAKFLKIGAVAGSAGTAGLIAIMNMIQNFF